MPISAYVIRFAARDREGVLRRLEGVDGVLMGEAGKDGVAVVADTGTTGEAEEVGQRLTRLEGVKSATLVYHNFEDAVVSGDGVGVETQV